MQFKDIYSKYKDVIPYAVFGVLTTIVNIATYYVSAHIMRLTVMASTFIAWVLAVLFAYITNRRWVFHSEVHAISDILTEMIAFFLCRLATGAVDWACMWLFVDVIHLNDVVIKIVANIVVIILNYIASKLLIFRHK